VRTLSFAAQALALLSPGFQVHMNNSSSRNSRHNGSSPSSPPSSNVVFAAGAEDTLAQFFAAITAPFVEYQRRYGPLEEEHAWAAAEALLNQMAPSNAGTTKAPPQAPPSQKDADYNSTPAPSAASATPDAPTVAGSDAATEPVADSTPRGAAAGVGAATGDSKQAAVERFEGQVFAVCRFAPEALTCASAMTRR